MSGFVQQDEHLQGLAKGSKESCSFNFKIIYLYIILITLKIAQPLRTPKLEGF